MYWKWITYEIYWNLQVKYTDIEKYTRPPGVYFKSFSMYSVQGKFIAIAENSNFDLFPRNPHFWLFLGFSRIWSILAILGIWWFLPDLPILPISRIWSIFGRSLKMVNFQHFPKMINLVNFRDREKVVFFLKSEKNGKMWKRWILRNGKMWKSGIFVICEICCFLESLEIYENRKMVIFGYIWENIQDLVMWK